MVATLDIKNFFGTTRFEMFEAPLHAAGFRDDALAAIRALTLFEGFLPQGAPTSPFLANLALLAADFEILLLCRRNQMDFTRYIDDIAVSGMRDLIGAKGHLSSIIESKGFALAQNKVLFRGQDQEQVVTGLVVNKKLRPRREWRSKLKDEIQGFVDGRGEELADESGLSLVAFKARLCGQAQHLIQFDRSEGTRLLKKARFGSARKKSEVPT